MSSFYDALAVTFEKRFSHGFQSLLSYTWAHEIDDGQGAGSNAIFYSSPTSTFNGNYGSTRAAACWISGTGWPSRSYGRRRYAQQQRFRQVHGKQLAAFEHHHAGQRTAYGQRHHPPDRYPGPGMLSTSSINGFGANTRVPFWPVDSLYTAPVYREDLRLTKMIPLPEERFKLSLSFEAFNLTNTWSPTSLTTQAYTETKGVLTLTPTAYNVGSADGGFPDGTQARRLQVSARITF